ncbi:MAG: helix-turn-helix domain-containing protein [Alphaproteobacteria bacterium]|nr:helix-turn-helix domain-containing protein [Alphaproteobacteria bacterium]
MKQMKKILLIQIPPAVERALTEQLQTGVDWEIAVLTEAPPVFSRRPDLVVTGGGGAAVFSGCPVLALSWAKPRRLGAVLRQIGQMLAQPVLYTGDIAIGPYTFKPQEKSLTRPDGEDIALTDREVDILAYLARSPGQPVSRDELLKNVWQYQEGIDTHTLETHIYRLRQKIEASAEEPRLLLTVGGGYSLHLS